jgi:hypothetical protein
MLAASAEAGPIRDLRALPPSEHVVAVTLCRGHYDVVMKDGSHRQYNEGSLAFKVDTSELGPRASPVLVPSGRFRDRAFIVYPSLEALRGVKSGCAS